MKVRRAISWTTAGVAVAQASLLAKIFIVASVTNVHDIGIYAVSASIVAAAWIFGDGGLRQLYLSRQADFFLNDKTCLLSSVWIGVLTMSFVAMMLTIPASYAISFFLKIDPTQLISMSLMIALSSFLGSLSNPFLLFSERQADFLPSVKCESFGNLVSLLFVALFVNEWQSIWILPASQILYALVVVTVSYFFKRVHLSHNCNFRAAWQLLTKGKPFLVISITTYVTYNLDKIVLGAMLSPAAVGIYFLAQKIAEIPGKIFSSIVGRLALPLYAGQKSEIGLSNLRSIMYKNLFIVLLIFGIISLACYVNIKFSVWAPDEKWLELTYILPLMLLAVGLRSGCHVLSPGLIAIGRVGVDAKLKVVESTLYLFLLPLLIFIAGLYGAVFAFLGIYLVALVGRYLALNRLMGD